MSKIDILTASLAEDQRSLLEDMQFWGNVSKMERVLFEVQKTHKVSASIPDSQPIRAYVEQFEAAKKIETTAQLRYLSFGLCMSLSRRNWSIIESSDYRQIVLSSVSERPPAHRVRLIYALSYSYFSFRRHDEPSPEAVSGWESLRDFLSMQIPMVHRATNHMPKWLDLLSSHMDVFTETPCDVFGAIILAGRGEEFHDFVSAIGIPDDSWFRQDVLLAQIRAACGVSDEKFVERLHELIRLMSQPSSVGASERVSRLGTGTLLHRYSQLKNCVEDEELRDSSLALIGNPWLNPHSWSLHVRRPDDTPSTEAHEMVTSWLKQRLIRDFFEVLAADGATDKRRLKYWLRHERSIEDLWLFLGDDAARSIRPNFKEIRKRAAGRTMFLTNAGPPANNAFGMKINGLWIIEFGQTGNACYIYRTQEFPVSLKSSGSIRGDANGLKLRNVAIERLRHIDTREGNWESRFSRVLGHYGVRSVEPIQSPVSNDERIPSPPIGAPSGGAQARTYHWGKGSEKTQSLDMARLEGLRIHARFKIQDNRKVGGALWVLGVDDSYPTLKVQLRAMGFQYKPNRGWWYQGP